MTHPMTNRQGKRRGWAGLVLLGLLALNSGCITYQFLHSGRSESIAGDIIEAKDLLEDPKTGHVYLSVVVRGAKPTPSGKWQDFTQEILLRFSRVDLHPRFTLEGEEWVFETDPEPVDRDCLQTLGHNLRVVPLSVDGSKMPAPKKGIKNREPTYWAVHGRSMEGKEWVYVSYNSSFKRVVTVGERMSSGVIVSAIFFDLLLLPVTLPSLLIQVFITGRWRMPSR